MELVKKQLLLPKSMAKRYEKLAKTKEQSFSEIVVQELKSLIPKKPAKKRRTKKQMAALNGLIGLYSSGVTDGSVHHDKELYGS